MKNKLTTILIIIATTFVTSSCVSQKKAHGYAPCNCEVIDNQSERVPYTQR
ncbi:MAG: hypothetical protein MJ069_06145 [Salinivirgaceae bacterium]|nr:hypothetical protein [Salinivirgaceae bacterium]